MTGRVLVVEANQELRENLAEILIASGYPSTAAGSRQEALPLLATGYQVAVVDATLPDSDGFTFAAELKAGNPDGEVVVLTGHPSLEAATAAVKAGVWACLAKPFSTPNLLMTVDQALKQARALIDKRTLQRRAQVAEKLAAVGTLTAGLSHEIRNPLNAASLQLQVLERRVRKLEATTQVPLLEPLGLVRDEIRRLDQILADFLQFARPTPLSHASLDVSGVVDRVVSLLKVQAEKKGLRLETRYLARPRVTGDADRLQQVLMNLTLNALDASPPGGTIILTCSAKAPEAQVSVEDSGPGIAPHAAEHIFEPFFTTKPSGTGLGLSISHSIVTQHGGHLRVEQSTLGGARFVVSLPLDA